VTDSGTIVLWGGQAREMLFGT